MTKSAPIALSMDSFADAVAEEAEYAAYWREVPKFVLSTTLPDTGEWNVTVIRSVDPVAIRRLADSLDGDLFVGGGLTVDAFRRAGLVDEWRIYTHPVVVGGGRRLLLDGPSAELDLLATRTFSNGVVLTHYAVRRGQG